MYTLTINVTKDSIEKAIFCSKEINFSKTSCAIAHAVRDIFPTAIIYFNHIELDGKRIALPTIASEFIEVFDRIEPNQRIKLKPISFQVSMPDEIIDKLNIDDLKQQLKNHPTLELNEA